MRPLVSIVILNYNGKRFNKACLESVLQQNFDNFEIIFVDNNSHDGSVDDVEKHFQSEINSAKIKLIQSSKNTGYSGGNNLGVLHSSPESTYICLLNNDTTVPPEWLGELIKCIESNTHLGGVGSLVLDQDREQELKDFYFKEHKTGLNNYILEPARRAQTPEEIVSGVYNTTGIGGCSFLYKKNLVDKPFPDYYFAYAEDTFLSLCILLTGHSLALCTKSIVFHYGSGSFDKKMTIWKSFHGIKNNLSNLYLFHSTLYFLLLFPVFLFYQLVKILTSSPIIRLLGFLKALGRILTHPGELVAQKRRIHRLTKIPYRNFLSHLSPIIFENIYFIKITAWKIQLMGLINNLYIGYFKLIGLYRKGEK